MALDFKLDDNFHEDSTIILRHFFSCYQNGERKAAKKGNENDDRLVSKMYQMKRIERDTMNEQTGEIGKSLNYDSLCKFRKVS